LAGKRYLVKGGNVREKYSIAQKIFVDKIFHEIGLSERENRFKTAALKKRG
jgi:hypothetical protein